MATFSIARKEDAEVVFSGRITDASAFRNELLWIRGSGHADLCRATVRGKELSVDQAIAAADAAIAAAIAKKELTHKRITYHDGVCGALADNTARTIWVRK